MKYKLLKQIRERFCIKKTKVPTYLLDYNAYYTAIDRYKVQIYQDVCFDRLIDNILGDIYGVIASGRIQSKHNKLKKKREMEKQVRRAGFEPSKFSWLGK